MIDGKNRFLYRVFGLRIASDIYLPELIRDEGLGEINITIVKGIVPTKIDNVIWEEEYVKISQCELVFEIENVAKYHLINGSTITVEVNGRANDNSVKLYLLGTALGTLLLQRGIVPVHGSTVVINGGAVIFSGVSGAGKSTLSSAFRKMGYLFLADDISVVEINNEGIPVVQPGYPQQKLWSDSLKVMREDTSRLLKVSTQEDKYAVPIKEGFLDSPVPLLAVFEIISKECNRVKINRISGIDKLQALLRNIYRETYLKILGTNSDYFKQCLEISRNVKFFKLVRPKDIFSIEKQIELILKEFIKER